MTPQLLLCAVSRLVFAETSCCRPHKCHISTEQLPEAMPVTWEASLPGQYMMLELSTCAGTVYALECARACGAAVHMYGFNWHDKHGDTHPRIREEYAYVQKAEQDGLLIVHPTGVLLFSQVRCCDSGWKTTSPQCSRLGTEIRIGPPDAACFPRLHMHLPHPMLGPLERCVLCVACAGLRSCGKDAKKDARRDCRIVSTNVLGKDVYKCTGNSARLRPAPPGSKNSSAVQKLMKQLFPSTQASV